MKKNNNDGKQSYILTRETLGMTILLFCALLLIALLTHRAVFSSLGAAVCTFMYGTFGYGSYLVVAALAYLGFWLVFEKKLNVRPVVVCIIGTTVFMLFLLFHAVSTRNFDLNASDFGNYLAQCYYSAEQGYSGYTFGGVVCALIVYPIAKGTTFIGAYVIFSILSVLCAYLTYLTARSNLMNKPVSSDRKAAKIAESPRVNVAEQKPAEAVQDRLYTVNENYEIVNNSIPAYNQQAATDGASADTEIKDDEDKFSSKNLGRKILFENGEFAAESYRRNMIFNEDSYFNHPVHNESDYLNSFSSGKSSAKPVNTQSSYSESYSREVESREEEVSTPSYVYGEKPANSFGDFESSINNQPVIDEAAEADYSRTIREDSAQEDSVEIEEPVEDTAPEYVQPAYDEPAVNGVYVSTEDDYSVESYSEPEPIEDVDETPVDNNPVVSESRDYDQAIRYGNESVESEPPTRAADNSLRSIFSSSNSNISDSVMPDASRLTRRREESKANLFDDNEEEVSQMPDLGARGLRADSGQTNGNNILSERSRSSFGFTNENTERTSVSADNVVPQNTPKPRVEEIKKEQPAEPEKPKHVWKKYVRPTLDLLDDYPEDNFSNIGEIEESKQIIIETLESFRIASHILGVVVGPAITRYDVVIEDKTNIKTALKYRESIAMALMKENVTAYLNYSKGAISIEVPNSKRALVGLKSMLTSSQFINSKPNSLTFALGKDVEGKANCPDITKMPHLLVAGTTGSGKSICLSALIISLLYKYGPDELRFILVDPKQAEFISYENLPHLMINEIIYDVDKAIKALNWAIKEMERRYALFKDMTVSGTLVKNINEYNANLPEGEEKLPKIVIILDEFGDLMLQAKKDIESRIIRLVQKSRACGIHLILATQRPSVDCITGLIKSNLPTRIGFKVNSFDDSRTIFDIGGAEKLLGKGDLYFRSAENPELNRIQGCFIDSPEVQAVTDYVKKHNETYFDQSVSDFINKVEEEEEAESSGGDEMGGDSDIKIDDKFIQALKFCVVSNQASVSMLQRRFPIGYVKACKIIDWMENMNYITQSEGSKPRKVLLSLDEFTRIYGDVDV
ncbi:MAG: DNA translocase FtsK [Candidatus Coproplasma sp.]